MKRLAQAGFALVRSSGPHDVFAGPGGVHVSVPRHREIKESTAKAILEQAGLR